MRNVAQVIFGCLLLAVAPLSPANADFAVHRNHHVAAPRALLPRAEFGDRNAQYRLALMYWTGRGMPRNDFAAAWWARRAAIQGEPGAQYLLGLLYDKGQGVPQDYVAAYMWLNLSSAHTRALGRKLAARMRDAVATKMTYEQLAEAQQRSVAWYPIREQAR